MINLMLCDCLEQLKTLQNDSVDSIVTDPPYGLSFMGKKWDYDVPSVEVWVECLRVLKPGGHLLAFAGTRTQHRMAVRIEDAGFEIRDMIAWVYGSGFPKSLDVSKAIDKATGAEREVLGTETRYNEPSGIVNAGRGSDVRVLFERSITTPATPEAQQWQGWGTALKPALEPITVARKPLAEKTVAANVLAHGAGGINVDGCRVGTDDVIPDTQNQNIKGGAYCSDNSEKEGGTIYKQNALGRFPANFIHDGDEEATDLLKDAARFFYCAKASKRDRGVGNSHPTVKPTDLMRYLCRLVTPPNGTVLDPFMGSGSTGKAAVLEGFNFIGCELSDEYMEIAKGRINGLF